MMPSSRYQLRIESIVSSTDEDEAGAGLLGHALDADVEPHRAVERGPLGDEDVLQLVAERLRPRRRRRSSRPRGPTSVMVSTTRSMTWRSDDSRSGVPSVPRKYFWATMLVALTDHDDGELDAELLEGDGAVLPVRDAGVATLPDDLVVRIDARRGEQPTEADSSDRPIGRWQSFGEAPETCDSLQEIVTKIVTETVIERCRRADSVSVAQDVVVSPVSAASHHNTLCDARRGASYYITVTTTVSTVGSHVRSKQSSDQPRRGRFGSDSRSVSAARVGGATHRFRAPWPHVVRHRQAPNAANSRFLPRGRPCVAPPPARVLTLGVTALWNGRGQPCELPTIPVHRLWTAHVLPTGVKIGPP